MIGILSITSIGALIVAAIACYTDVRTGKIFNWLTFPAAGVGIILRAVEYGMQNPNSMVASAAGGALNGVAGWILAVFIMSLMKLFMKQMGHGDSKLMGALGAFVGPALIFGTFFYYCGVYALYSIGKLALNFPWNQAFAAYAAKDKSAMDLTKFNEVRKKPHPVAPLITAGLLIALIFPQQTLNFFGLNPTAKTPDGAQQSSGSH